ncbi:hypothetical protein LIER_16958 [Lithospermum erythrorhizon]|uniref:Uncharacterized protein n=1 Tax=Lithospermum erythrorhizon TaxID=34254 RepID=A0AAV3QAZ0_LITER
MSTIDSSIKWIQKEHKGGPPVSREFRLAYYCAVYMIWLARNAWAHDREEVSPDSIISKVKLESGGTGYLQGVIAVSSLGCILLRAALSGFGLVGGGLVGGLFVGGLYGVPPGCYAFAIFFRSDSCSLVFFVLVFESMSSVPSPNSVVLRYLGDCLLALGLSGWFGHFSPTL